MWSGILIGGFQRPKVLRSNQKKTARCFVERCCLRINLETALPLPLWPIQKTIGFDQKNAHVQFSCVVCLRRLLSVVATIQARRRGSAVLFANPRRGFAEIALPRRCRLQLLHKVKVKPKLGGNA